MNRTGILLVLFSLMTIVSFSQSWIGSIGRMNEYTRQYDPYKRVFTYTESSRKLAWVTSDGDITCEARLSEVKVYTESSGSNTYVTFSCLDNSDCIYCSYGGNTKITSITLTNESIANEIVKEIQSINGGGSAPVAAPAASIPSSGSNNGPLFRINELCRQYDPYIRTFSFNPSSGVLTWVNKDGDITCSTMLSKVSVTVVANTSDYSVMFTCLDKSSCINSNYLGATERSSITVTTRTAADEIVQKINSLK
jgi:hypothetical protein